MADRTVVYRLQAETTQFQAKMAAAGASARKAGADMGTSIDKGATKASSALDGMGINAGTVALAVGTTVVMATANFEKAMSGVQAATHETAANMDALRDAALDAGASTAFSASEAAAGIENLAKAGISTSDILGGGLTGALDLAAAGQLDVATASEIAATALTQFKLSGEDVPHVADLLAAGAGKAQGDVSDLSMALKQSGLVASQMGISIEETTGTLAAFASAGLLGSDAGTSFRTMLLRMANPSKESADLMQQLGISAYDASGQFVGMASVAGQLKTAFEGKTQAERDSAMATIFGSDAIRAASVLYSEGSEGVSEWTANVNDAGYAAETAAIQLDNLKGDVEELQGALETAFIEGGDDTQGMLRGVTQLATDLVNLQTEAETADGALGSMWDSAMGALNPIGRLTDSYHGIKGAISDTDESSQDLDKTLESTAGSTDSLATSADDAGTSLADMAESAEEQAKALDKARERAHETAGSFVNLSDALNDSEVSLGQWISKMAEQADALRNFRVNAQKAADQGLRKGLIAALQEAGPEGAMRMRQLANATDEEIGRANRAWQRGQAEMAKYVNFKVPPKKLAVESDEAISRIRAVRTEIESLDGKTASVFIRTVRTESGKGPVLETRAEGGYITGPGTPTSDSIPAYLSNGEYVIKAAAVQKYGTHMFDGLNAMRFADGGSVSKNRTGAAAFGPTDAQLEREEKRQRRREEREEAAERRDKEAHEAEMQARADWLDGQEKATSEWLSAAEKQKSSWESIADDLASQMESIGRAATSPFQSDLFGGSGSIWGSGGTGWRGALGSDISGLESRQGIIAALRRAGLDSEALGAALAQGSNADLQGLINRGEVQAFEDMFNQRAALTASVSGQAGAAAFGAEFAAANAQVAAFGGQVAALTAELDRIQALISPMSEAAIQGYQYQGQVLAGAVSNAIVNGTGTVARRGNR